MDVVFRVDASLQMGAGHVMRCLTLADALVAKGAVCQFISCGHEGNLIDLVRGRGYTTHTFHPRASLPKLPGDLAHACWLGNTQAQDAEYCASFLAAQRPEWLIVDHYALDARWERAMTLHYQKLLAIDDLADRPHACDLILDQTFGREAQDYRSLVSANCRVLCGSQYVLLRPEFAALRPYSLQRRARPALRQLLVTMGGVDKDNATGRVLQALSVCPLPSDCQITVIMGSTAPWLEDVRSQAQGMSWPTQVLAGIRDMAQVMANCDLAIGAAGSTSWERCCLGVPTIMLVLA
ncbi:MAG TPA: UDP-2,4-diacetamido-2,4,6-trideoxy-beta-L-altropyranose hydrolase, partial [Hydrogenophaga sp.]|nr:UDP-2,4-diacetamido-2,4,6-trideoxy-beta-L-altropyranose hydrolase [Hydrogenophaga sp.]